MRTNKKALRLLGLVLALALLVSCLPLAGLTASAAKVKGAYFSTGFPRFAYVITGVTPEDAENTVKLYQNPDMTSYDTYTGDYTIQGKVMDPEDMRFYTVNEIGGASGDILGALQNVPAQGIVLPETITIIGSLAFAGASRLSTLTFPSSVEELASDAFQGVNLTSLKFSVVTAVTLKSETSYLGEDRSVPIELPSAITELDVTSPLTVDGQVAITGPAAVNESEIIIAEGGKLAVGGQLSGDGVVEVKEASNLTLGTTSPNFKGTIRLTALTASFTNNGETDVTVQDASGASITAAPGETVYGGKQEEPDPEDNPLSPQITTNEGGSVAVEDSGKVVVITADEGYYVKDVVINGLSMGDITRYEFETASASNTVEVTFAEGDPEEGPVLPTIFTDVKSSDSFAQAVNLLAQDGIFNGVGNDRFAPEATTTRAMYATVFKRLEVYGSEYSLPERLDDVQLSDVPEEKWYTEAAYWAVASQLADADEQGNFRPNATLTREDAAMMLYRFTRMRGYGALVDAGRYRFYRDATLLEGESRNAMVWAATKGYISADNRTLNPSGTITRAELAEMLVKYLNLLDK